MLWIFFAPTQVDNDLFQVIFLPRYRLLIGAGLGWGQKGHCNTYRDTPDYAQTIILTLNLTLTLKP